VTFVKYFSGPINPISQLLVRTHLDHHRLLKKIYTFKTISAG